MRPTVTEAFVVLALLLAGAAACGSDEEADGDGAATGGTGEGAVSIGDAAFPFDASTCVFGDDGDVLVEGSGAGEGLTYDVTVTRTAPDGIVRESVRLAFSPQELSTLTNLFTAESGTARLDVSGSSLTGAGEFLSAGGAPAGEGTVDVRC